MKKILLIEDRVERQNRFTLDTGILLDIYKDILDRKETLDKNSLDNNYSVIITHRSAFGESDENILDYLKKYCEEHQTKLVFFSGGISSTFYSKIKYEFLLLNSKSFYSKNLELFLDNFQKNQEPNVLLLGYGKDWKINILLNTLEKINLFISNNETKERVKFNKFKTETKIENIADMIKFEYPQIGKGNGVFLDDLKALSKDIKFQIQKEVEFND
jgi:hypothetical protein